MYCISFLQKALLQEVDRDVAKQSKWNFEWGAPPSSAAPSSDPVTAPAAPVAPWMPSTVHGPAGSSDNAFSASRVGSAETAGQLVPRTWSTAVANHPSGDKPMDPQRSAMQSALAEWMASLHESLKAPASSTPAAGTPAAADSAGTAATSGSALTSTTISPPSATRGPGASSSLYADSFTAATTAEASTPLAAIPAPGDAASRDSEAPGAALAPRVSHISAALSALTASTSSAPIAPMSFSSASAPGVSDLITGSTPPTILTEPQAAPAVVQPASLTPAAAGAGSALPAASGAVAALLGEDPGLDAILKRLAAKFGVSEAPSLEGALNRNSSMEAATSPTTMLGSADTQPSPEAPEPESVPATAVAAHVSAAHTPLAAQQEDLDVETHGTPPPALTLAAPVADADAGRDALGSAELSDADLSLEGSVLDLILHASDAAAEVAAASSPAAPSDEEESVHDHYQLDAMPDPSSSSSSPSTPAASQVFLQSVKPAPSTESESAPAQPQPELEGSLPEESTVAAGNTPQQRRRWGEAARPTATDTTKPKVPSPLSRASANDASVSSDASPSSSIGEVGPPAQALGKSPFRSPVPSPSPNARTGSSPPTPPSLLSQLPSLTGEAGSPSLPRAKLFTQIHPLHLRVSQSPSNSADSGSSGGHGPRSPSISPSPTSRMAPFAPVLQDLMSQAVGNVLFGGDTPAGGSEASSLAGSQAVSRRGSVDELDRFGEVTEGPASTDDAAKRHSNTAGAAQAQHAEPDAVAVVTGAHPLPASSNALTTDGMKPPAIMLVAVASEHPNPSFSQDSKASADIMPVSPLKPTELSFSSDSSSSGQSVASTSSVGDMDTLALPFGNLPRLRIQVQSSAPDLDPPLDLSPTLLSPQV